MRDPGIIGSTPDVAHFNFAFEGVHGWWDRFTVDSKSASRQVPEYVISVYLELVTGRSMLHMARLSIPFCQIWTA